jgi:hypothetical protein
MLAGKVPKLPGFPPNPDQQNSYVSWKQRADTWAAFWITLLIPWTLDGQPGLPLTYRSLTDHMDLIHESGSWVQKARLNYLKSATIGLKSSSDSRGLSNAYRHRNTETRRDAERNNSNNSLRQPPRNPSDPDHDTVSLFAPSEANDLQGQQLADFTTQVHNAMQRLHQLAQDDTIIHSRQLQSIQNTAEALDQMIHQQQQQQQQQQQCDDEVAGASTHSQSLPSIIHQSSIDAIDGQTLLHTLTAVTKALSKQDFLTDPPDTPPPVPDDYSLLAAGSPSAHQPVPPPSQAVLDRLGQDSNSLYDNLNQQQRDIVDYVIDYLQSCAQQSIPSPPHLLIHGPPGTGKTYLIKALHERMQQLGLGVLRTAALTGVAASHLPAGRTTHNLFAISINRAPSSMSNQVLLLKQQQWDNTSVILIDEVSMISPRFLGMLSSQADKILETSSDHGFGNLPLILVGDFFQIPPVTGSSLPELLVEQTTTATTTTEASPASRPSKPLSPLQLHGLHVFQSCLRINLTIQQRAADDLDWQQRVINPLRDTSCQYPVSATLLDSLRPLTSADYPPPSPSLAPSTSFINAPIVTSLNRARCFYIRTLSYHFATYHKVPVFYWFNPHPHPTTRLPSPPLPMYGELASSFPQLQSFFAPGMPATLTSNINPSCGLANGTSVVFRGLVFDIHGENAQLSQQALEIYQNAQPGHTYLLPIHPDAILVSLPSDCDQWPQNAPSVPMSNGEHGLLPILLDKGKQHNLTILPPKRGLPDSAVKVSYFLFGVESALSVTYHRVQGRTISKVILDLNSHHTGMGGMLTIPKLYVGLTRVRCSDDLRILPLTSQDKQKLLKLQHSDFMKIWNASYTIDSTNDIVSRWDPLVAQRNRTQLLSAQQNQAAPARPPKRRRRQYQPSSAGNIRPTSSSPSSSSIPHPPPPFLQPIPQPIPQPTTLISRPPDTERLPAASHSQTHQTAPLSSSPLHESSDQL